MWMRIRQSTERLTRRLVASAGLVSLLLIPVSGCYADWPGNYGVGADAYYDRPYGYGYRSAPQVVVRPEGRWGHEHRGYYRGGYPRYYAPRYHPHFERHEHYDHREGGHHDHHGHHGR